MELKWLHYRLRRLTSDRSGQSAVEYLIICSCLVAALLAAPNLYNTFSDIMANKYKSYAFGIALSEPPSKSIDDKEQEVTKVVHIIREVFDAVGDLGKDILGLSTDDSLPPLEALKKFFHTLKSIFSK